MVRIHIASIAKTPAAAPAANTSRASAAFRQVGFSISTALPAAIASNACS